MNTVKLGLAALMTALTAIGAQLRFNIGPVPYTFQNLAIVLAGLVLPTKYAVLSQLLYILLIGMGLPIAAGFKGGLGVLIGFTAGYLWGAPITAGLMSFISKTYLRVRGIRLSKIGAADYFVLLIISLVAVLPMYILGFAVFVNYAVPGSNLFAWSASAAEWFGFGFTDPLMILFISTIVIFIPQDLLMDHTIAIVLSKTMAKLLEARGVEI
jgi:biotin transport system substrate-specific component